MKQNEATPSVIPGSIDPVLRDRIHLHMGDFMIHGPVLRDRNSPPHE
jgi:hypothetical protein